jgi:hypothetical protein
MKTAREFINPNVPPAFEKVWKMFEETREQIAATEGSGCLAPL